MKDENKLYKMMKKFWSGKGSNFTLKFFNIFGIVECVALHENDD